MRKTTLVIILSVTLAFVGWYSYTRISISSGINDGVQKAENKDLKSQLDTSLKAKDESSKSTIRADRAKESIRAKEEQSKEKLRDSFTSIDDEPLSDSTIIELCRTYNYQDCVPKPTR